MRQESINSRIILVAWLAAITQYVVWDQHMGLLRKQLYSFDKADDGDRCSRPRCSARCEISLRLCTQIDKYLNLDSICGDLSKCIQLHLIYIGKQPIWLCRDKILVLLKKINICLFVFGMNLKVHVHTEDNSWEDGLRGTKQPQVTVNMPLIYEKISLSISFSLTASLARNRGNTQ